MPPKAKQSRISFESTTSKASELPTPQLKKVQPAKVISRSAAPPSLRQDPRVIKLLDEWTDSSPKYHCDELSSVEKLLLQFDNRMEYGASAGISRFERFKRAEKLGLNPPVVLGEILTAHDSQSVYH